MCGITGLIQLDGAAVSETTLRDMTRVIAHRGPDGEGIHVDGCVGLGHRRLSVIDLSPAGAQPMCNEDGNVWVTYNGEIYNFPDLRNELEKRGHQFRSKTDTEVLVHGYEEWGDTFVKRLNGMFAFAIWDAKNKSIFFARDRYGIKPLYYYHQNGLFAFGSEIKSLLKHPAVHAAVNPWSLLEYFTFQNIFTDRTLFDGVKLFPPGHTGVFRLSEPEKGIQFKQYWDFNFCAVEEAKDDREYEEELNRLFAQAVNRQLISDVPVGAYLSGGMDSGAITAIAAKQIPYLISFTCGFDLSSVSGLELAFDERQRAEAMSYLFKTEHYEVVLKAGDMERVLPELIWHLEDLRVGQCYPNYYVSRLAGKFIKVVLAGTGGDEVFAGYPWRYYRAVNNQDFDEYVDKYYLYWQRLVPNKVIHRLFQDNIWEQVKDTLTIDIFRDVIRKNWHEVETPEDYVNQSLYFESKTFLHGLLLVEDKLSMAHGLETRVPFLDNDLVDFAMRLPLRFKLRDLDQFIRPDENEPGNRSTKYIEQTNDGKILLRKTLQRYLPQEYVTGAKQGFSAPDATWFRGDSLQYVERLMLDQDARIYEYLRRDTVYALVREHIRGERNRRLLIWSLLSFEWWLRNFLPGK